MKNEITQRIIQYLEADTNYAVILNGSYGIGKTYFIKNELFPEIEKKFNINDKEKKIIPILVSLFGINSFAELQNRIFIECNPNLKNKVWSIGNELFKGIVKFKGGSSEDIFSIGKYFLNYENIFLCLDDIDRRSKSLEISEIFGFINNVIENSNGKILIISKEEIFQKNEDKKIQNEYATIKEKVIGITLNFQNDIEVIFDALINKKYLEFNKRYFDFLNLNKNLILKRIEQNENNLRNLIFFLEEFKIIFNALEEGITDQTNNELSIFKNEILNTILNFALPISIEFKIGALQPNNYIGIKELYNNHDFIGPNIFSIPLEKNEDEIVNEETNYLNAFENKYFDTNQKVHYLESVFGYLTGNTVFSFTKLLSELHSIYKFEDNVIPEKEIVLKELSYWDFVDLNYKTYRALTNKMLQYSFKGEYKLEEYNTVFHYATRFDNFLNLNLETLLKKLKKGIKVGICKYKYNEDLEFQLKNQFTENHDFKIYHEGISTYCLEINELLVQKEIKKENSRIFELFKNNFNDFLEELKISPYHYHNPIFHGFDFNSFWIVLINLQNSQVIKFGYFIQNRYKNKSRLEGLNLEKNFLSNLKNKLDKRINSKKISRFDKISLGVLNNSVKIALGKFREQNI